MPRTNRISSHSQRLFGRVSRRAIATAASPRRSAGEGGHQAAGRDGLDSFIGPGSEARHYMLPFMTPPGFAAAFGLVRRIYAAAPLPVRLHALGRFLTC